MPIWASLFFACVHVASLLAWLLLIHFVHHVELVRERQGPWNRTHGSRGLFYSFGGT